MINLYQPSAIKLFFYIGYFLSIEAFSADLIDVYELAQKQDTTLAIAYEKSQAQYYQTKQYRAYLLPQLTAQIDYLGFNQEKNHLDGSNEDTNTHQYTLILTQSLFNPNAWFNYQAQKKEGHKATLVYTLAQQELIIRSAESYFNLLRAQDTLSNAQSEKKAIYNYYQQSEKRLNAGVISNIDFQATKAQYHLAKARIIQSTNQVNIQRQVLQQITQKKGLKLIPLQEKIAFKVPEKTVEQWIEQGVSQYKGIHIAKKGLQAAQDKHHANGSQYSPTLSLSYRHTKNQTNPDINSNAYNDDGQWLLQANWNLSLGGQSYFQAKQSAIQAKQATLELESQIRWTKQRIYQAHANVTTHFSQINAHKQALLSSKKALFAAEEGYALNVRTSEDVFNALANVSLSKTALTHARYDYIISLLYLHLYSGVLNKAVLHTINQWLHQKNYYK